VRSGGAQYRHDEGVAAQEEFLAGDAGGHAPVEVLLKLLERKHDLAQRAAAARPSPDKQAIDATREEEETFNLLCCIRSLATSLAGWAALVQHLALAPLIQTGLLEPSLDGKSGGGMEVVQDLHPRLQLALLDILSCLLAPSWASPAGVEGAARAAASRAGGVRAKESDGALQQEHEQLQQLRTTAVTDHHVFDTCLRLVRQGRGAAAGVAERCGELLKVLVLHSRSVVAADGSGATSVNTKMQRALTWVCGELGLPFEDLPMGEDKVNEEHRIIDVLVRHAAGEHGQSRAWEEDAGAQGRAREMEPVEASTLQHAAALASQRGARGLSPKPQASPKSKVGAGGAAGGARIPVSSPAKKANPRTSARPRPSSLWSCAPRVDGAGARHGGLLVSTGSDWSRRLSFGAVQDVLQAQQRERAAAELAAQEAGIVYHFPPTNHILYPCSSLFGAVGVIPRPWRQMGRRRRVGVWERRRRGLRRYGWWRRGAGFPRLEAGLLSDA